MAGSDQSRVGRQKMISPDKTQVLYGDRFVTNGVVRTTVMVVWAAPCTGGYEVDIPIGTVLVAQRDQVKEATSFNCIPENYKELEKRFVPASDRFAMKYSGYYLIIPNEELGVRLQCVSRANRSERRWYDFKEKMNKTINDNMLVQMTIFVLATIFIIVTLPIKPFVDMYRRRKLAVRRKAEEIGQ